jgi:hypothetical protein
MTTVLSEIRSEGGIGERSEETFCYICKTTLKMLPSREGIIGMRRSGEVYVCERGHVYSREALIELGSYELP